MSVSDFRNRVRDIWTSMPPGIRRFAMFGFLILVVATIYYKASPERAPREKREQKSLYDFKQPEMAAEFMAEKLQTLILAQKNQMEQMRQRMDQLEGRMRPENGQAGSPSGNFKAGDAAFLREMDKTVGSSEIVDGGQVPYAPAPVLQLPAPGEIPQGRQTTPPRDETPETEEQAKAGAGKEGEDVPPPRSLGVLSWPPPAPAGQGAPDKNAMDKSAPGKPAPQGFYMPSASFFPVSLLTGLDAPTGNKAKNQPSPLALRVQDLSWLPNEIRQNVRGCFLLAEGIGELSTERVNIRGMSISCVNNDGERVIDQKLLGYVADSDGKAGMRGEVVSKAGKLLAETMKVGFLQGLSEFFQFNARSLTVTDSGAVSTPQSDELGNSLLGGASSGIGRALDKVASYYMSLAEEVFPVIQVGATRSATFVVTQGTEIIFDKKLTIGNKEREHDL